jgi:primosomal protein N' (replication factor Y)
VIAADTALHLPDFRCSERTFQLLTQVAGRAGRRTADSQVLIQSYNPEHYALQAAQEHDYHQFYASEIAFRQQAAYPPLTRMVRLLYTHSKEHKAVAEAARLANELRHHAQQLQLANYTIVGPAPAFHHRVRKRWRYHLFLVMGEHPNNPPHALAKLLDAVGDMRGWTLDVDPMHVL